MGKQERRRKRKLARRKRDLRQGMVHAAGCVHPFCTLRDYAYESRSIVEKALDQRVRIPRSLRRHWGIP